MDTRMWLLSNGIQSSQIDYLKHPIGISEELLSQPFHLNHFANEFRSIEEYIEDENLLETLRRIISLPQHVDPEFAELFLSLLGLECPLGFATTLEDLRQKVKSNPTYLENEFKDSPGLIKKISRRLIPDSDSGGHSFGLYITTLGANVLPLYKTLLGLGFQDVEDIISLTPSEIKQHKLVPPKHVEDLKKKLVEWLQRDELLQGLRVASTKTFYRITALERVEQNLAIVTKPVLYPKPIANLCNFCVPNSSSPNAERISFETLKSKQYFNYGVFGKLEIIKEFLNGIGLLKSVSLPVDTGLHSCFSQFVNGPYAGKELVFTIFIPENNSFDEVSPKNSDCTFHRYLWQLCDRVFMCIDKTDLGSLECSFDRLENEDSSRLHFGEVQKTITQEDRFDFYPGLSFTARLDSTREWKSFSGYHRIGLLGKKLQPESKEKIKNQETYNSNCRLMDSMKSLLKSTNIQPDYYCLSSQKHLSFLLAFFGKEALLQNLNQQFVKDYVLLKLIEIYPHETSLFVTTNFYTIKEKADDIKTRWEDKHNQMPAINWELMQKKLPKSLSWNRKPKLTYGNIMLPKI